MNIEKSLQQVSEAKQNYYTKCYHFALSFVRKQKEEFTSENIRQAYELQNEQIPHEPRVWGAVMRSLSQGELIRFKGYTKYKSPLGHAKPSAVWESLISKKIKHE